MPLRDDDGDLVGRVVPYQAADPAVPLVGDDAGGPLRTADGQLVGRVALFQVSGGVAVPVTSLGGSASEEVTAEPPLVATPQGDAVVLSITQDQAGGVPILDGSGLVKLSQMPISGLNYHGNWDASTNTPTLADGTGTAGDMYRVHVAGTQDLGSGSITFDVGDLVVYEGAVWQKFEAATGVISVNGQTGAVSLTAADVGADASGAAAAVASDLTTHEGQTGVGTHVPTGGTAGQVLSRGSGTTASWTALPAAPVTSVAGKTGAVTLVKGDVGLGSVDNTADADKPISTATQAALDTKLTTPTLTTAVVLGTTLESNTIGLVGYGQDVLGDTLVMRQFGGQVSTATPQADTDAATKAYVDAQTHGEASDVTVYALSTDQPFASTTPLSISAFSQVAPDSSKTQVRLVEMELYISGAHEAGIQCQFTNSFGTITYNGSASMPANAGENMVFTEYDQGNGGIKFDPGDANIRKVTLSLFITTAAFGGQYGNLSFVASQQTSFGSPVTIHAGSKMTVRLLSSA